ncbi:class I SAM-dependent methyltransferase [Spiractinospora alimapuensis]|uniref:class I SAM-dependent methyltransferase n=1 Tax=Spiractinospora alimapuensis TaxID=2820884 RepID=UPI001F2CC887|nr:class I SAM-dependent methyltransferase [Spiractinospora alimapuensis]QVQ52847.1 class I SAM-dependent methyltransferase [Spiractinospora alimapuensis]
MGTDDGLRACWRYGALSSRGYDLDKPVGFSFGDVEFYSRLLAGTQGEILEPAVGNGRMLVPLLREGLRVRGYDTSPHMVELCRAHCAREGLAGDVFVDDLATYRAPGRYEAVVVPAGSFSLLPSPEAAVAALAAIRDSLVAGGRFVCDLEPPPVGVDIATSPRQWWDGEELITMSSMHTEFDPRTQRTTEWLRYELWEEGVLRRGELQVFSLLWFGLAEFTGMLTDAGFTSVTVYGDYDTSPPGPQADIWTFEALRA